MKDLEEGRALTLDFRKLLKSRDVDAAQALEPGEEHADVAIGQAGAA